MVCSFRSSRPIPIEMPITNPSLLAPLLLESPFSLSSSMLAFISSLTRSATKTLDFFIDLLHLDRRRPRKHHLRSHSTATISAYDTPTTTASSDLVSRFLSIHKKFPKPNPNPKPNRLTSNSPNGPLQYNALMAAFNRSNRPDEALRLFRRLKASVFFQPNLLIYTTAINALAESSRFDEAEALFKEAIDSGLVPDAACCTVLIKMYSFHLKQFSWAYAVINWMIGCGIRPDVVTYSTLISGLCRAGRIDEARHVLLMDMKRAKCDPNMACYGTVFDALVAARQYREAEELFWEMTRSGVAPDVGFCTNFVKMYAFDLESFDSAREVIRWMASSGYEADVVTYSTLVKGLCQAGRVEEASEVVDEMLREKCRPNCVTFTPLLQAYCSDGRVGEAKKLLDWMESVGCSPDVVSYNVLIQGLCEKGDFDEVETVLRESSCKGWSPDVVSYNSYIHGLCKVGRIDEAFRQLEVMLGKGLSPTVVTLNILLDRLCRESKIWEVKRLVERSFELGLDVDVVSFNTVMSRLCEVEEWLAAMKLFTDMLKKGIDPDTRSFNILIYCLCKVGKFYEAKCIFHSKGFVPDVVSCNILMHQYLLAGRIDELNHLISYMKTNDIAPDKVTCNIGVDSFCREGKFSEAIQFVKGLEDVYSQELIARLSHGLVKGGRLGDLLRLFEDLLDKGLVLDCQVYDFLITAFCNKGSCESKEIYKVCLILEKMLGI